MRTFELRHGVFFLCILLTICMGCDDSENPAKPQPDGDALHSFIHANIDEHAQTLTIDAAAGGQVVGAQGTIIQFPSDAFKTQAGGAVTGNVDIELIEIYNRSSMLLTNKPTIGKADNGDLATLVSGGEFFVNATQNGNQLVAGKAYTIIAPAALTGGIDLDMKLFTGVEECDGDRCNLVWEQEDRGIEKGQFQTTGGVFEGYMAIQSKFCWTNIDKWYNDPRQKTTIFVDVPEGFDNTNCAVYLVYDGEPTALARFDRFDEETGLFTEHYGLIPIGLEVHFVLVSIIDDEIHYAIQGATITENHVEVIDDVQSITEEELIDLIDELP